MQIFILLKGVKFGGKPSLFKNTMSPIQYVCVYCITVTGQDENVWFRNSTWFEENAGTTVELLHCSNPEEFMTLKPDLKIEKWYED